MSNGISDKTIGRLSLYRRLLMDLIEQKVEFVFSHDLAKAARLTAAQVRRDVMSLGHSGTPARGYNARLLLDSITAVLDAPESQPVALVGVGNLGRAILAYFVGRRPSLRIIAAFDSNPDLVDRVICGCRCYSAGAMPEVIRRDGIRAGIIAVPSTGAQEVANALVEAGVSGILNFAPARLGVPPHVYVEYMDFTTSLEKVAFFARRRDAGRAIRPGFAAPSAARISVQPLTL